MKTNLFIKVSFVCMLVAIALIGFSGCDEVTQPQVVMIGDSLLDMSGCTLGEKAIRTELAYLSGELYRTYDESGACMDGLGLLLRTPIPEQYENARQDDSDIRTVIMSGGGNDIIMMNPLVCSDALFGEECMEAFDGIMDKAEELVQQIVADGADVVYVSYLNDSAFDSFNKAMDYGMALAQDMLARYDGVGGSKVKFVDPRPYQEEHPEIDCLCLDQTHPTNEASVIMADMIWDTMVTYDMVR